MSNLKLLISYNLLPIGALFLLFISIMGTWGNVIDYNIYKNGFLINATVLEAPVSCEDISSRGGFCTLEYKGNKYITKAGKKFCYLVSGQKSVEMITDKNATKLLFPNEFTYFEFSSGFILMAVALIIIVKKFIPLSKINS
ncbi:MAG: hypothetical protein RRY99_09815 [Flavobacterium sp.]